MMENGGLTAADVAAVTNNGYGGMGGFGGDGWWVIVLLLALGGGRFGGNVGANGACASPADVNAAVDRQTFISKLDGLTYGITDATYALNNSITGGFAAAELSRANMAAEQAKCCCATQRLIENSTRDILENQNCNARAILDALTAQRIADKDEKIAEQNQKIFSLELAKSQAMQNNYLLNELRPSPTPAYVVSNPYCCNTCSGGYGYGFNG